MSQWIVILLIGLAILAVGVWVLRRRPSSRESQVLARNASDNANAANELAAAPIASRRHAAPDQKASSDVPVPVVQAANDTGARYGHSVEVSGGVPNTKIMPHPDDMPLATLEFEGPPGRVQVRRPETVIGRHSGDDIRVPDVRVSRHHARLVARSDGGFEIHNLTAVRSEPNEMLINGESREHADVADGDVVTLGGVSFRFMLAAG